MIQAVIFDFDGVILNSEPIHYEACNRILQNLGLNLSYQEYFERYLGVSDKQVFELFLQSNGLAHRIKDLDNLFSEKAKIYTDMIENHPNLPMVDEVDQYIFKILNEEKKIAICSGSTQGEIAAALGKIKQGILKPHFDIIITSEDVQNTKPFPDGYLLAAKRLDVPPEQCLVIEDTPHGIAAAKAAGMHAVAILTSYDETHFPHADDIIHGFKQLLD